MASPGDSTSAYVIRDASQDDADRIASLIRRAFEIQCRIYDDWTLPPMSESADSVRDAMQAGIVLVAEKCGRIVGTVQGRRIENGCVYVGRLAVDPIEQRRGVGRALAIAIESRYPDAERFRLFTGHQSEVALGLYRSLGYAAVRDEPQHERLTLVFLEKPGSTR